ncbi:hypothetical protein L6164_012207 [Bauhinia variegata]|uniref:Uncharacterized protein n=1 Tax=Bauhinia variegata TaxID=167791 RepID=A0ACB9PAV2_BAUVA|nr:hypothetical protein L6164_012207 [Bauhinia variegata]
MDNSAPDLNNKTARDISQITPKARVASIGDHEVDMVRVTYPSRYARYDNLSLDDAPSTSDLSRLGGFPMRFDVEACPLGVGVCEGREVEELRKKKRKTRDSSSIPTTSFTDYFLKKSRPASFISPPAPAPGTKPIDVDADDLPTMTQCGFEDSFTEVLATPFIDLPKDLVCPPLSWQGIRTKMIVRRDWETFVATASQEAIRLPERVTFLLRSGKLVSPKAEDFDALLSLFNAPLKATEGFLPLDPTALVAEFQHVCSNAMLGELATSFHFYFRIVQIINDRIKSEQYSFIELDDLQVAKDAVEEKASIAEERATAAE